MNHLTTGLLALVLLGAGACENLSGRQDRAPAGGSAGATGGSAVGGTARKNPDAGAANDARAGGSAGDMTKKGNIPGEEMLD